MLLHRILTAIPLALAVIWLILYQPTTVLLYVLLPVSFICGYEWARLGGLRSMLSQLMFAALLTAFCWVFIHYLNHYLYIILLLATAWWFAMLVFLKLAKPELKESETSQVKLSLAFLIVPSAIIAMYVVHGMELGDRMVAL